MKAIHLVNYYNSTNIGDNMITSYMESLIPEGYTVNKYSYSLSPLDQKHDYKNKKNSKLLFLKKIGIISKINYLRNYLLYVNKPLWIEYEEKLKNSKLLLIGGGNAIFDLDKNSYNYLFFKKHLQMAKKNNVPIFVCSIGIGPFQTNFQKNGAIKTLELADYITFRDEKSFKIFAESSSKKEIEITYDPVFSIFNNVRRNENNNFSIGINIMDLSLAKFDKKVVENYVFALRNLVIFLKNNKYQVKLFATENADYHYIQEKFIDIVLPNEIININSINKIDDFYNDISLCVSTRMHSAIIALSHEVLTIPIIWQDKVREMCKYCDLEKFVEVEGEFSEVEIINSINYYIKNFKQEKDKLRENNTYIKNNILKNNIIIEEFLR